jgi:hypothetical protein
MGPVGSKLESTMAPLIRGGELAQSERTGPIIKAVDLLGECVAVSEHEQSLEQVPVVTEPFAAATRGLGILALDRQVHVISDVLDNFVPGPCGST